LIKHCHHHHHHHHYQLTFLEWPLYIGLYCKDLCTGRNKITGKRKCHSESNSFVVAAEQVRHEPVVEHRQRRSWCHIAWQAVPTTLEMSVLTHSKTFKFLMWEERDSDVTFFS